MDSQQNNGTSMPFSEPKLCANNCGFWANPTTMNLCSACYKVFSANDQANAAAKAAFNVKPVVAKESSPAASIAVGSERRVAAEEEPAKPKAANRCGSCNRKVGLTAFKCKCGGMFCGDHRYPECHDCSFDYKTAGRDAIAKANPIVKADKVERF